MEGCIEAAGEKKVPLLLRILCAVLLVAFYGGLIGIFLCVAISNHSIAMFFITVLVALLILAAFIYKYKTIKKSSCFDNSYMALYMDMCDCNHKSIQYHFRIYPSKEICSETYHYE